MDDPATTFRWAWIEWSNGHPKSLGKLDKLTAAHFYNAGLRAAIHLARREKLRTDLACHDPLDILIGEIARRL